MNIEFENLSYAVKTKRFLRKPVVKEILKQINGEFRSCELSAILGPSGSGKSSMLNILSGYTTDYSGTLKLNDRVVNQKSIRRKSSYIMQENKLHEYLTVGETMTFAINLKVGRRLSVEQRQTKIESILESLGLMETFDDRAIDLSGGEQKRLSIALELIDDPSILFLDEPTTGLDASSSTQCVQLLKRLAQEGRTIIATIHSPSPYLFEIFDLVYTLAQGQVIYQGSSQNLVPFLRELDLPCPKFYSPSDFLLEIATHDYGNQNPKLVEKIRNGKSAEFRQQIPPPTSIEVAAIDNNSTHQSSSEKLSSSDNGDFEYSTSFLQQFYYLLIRSFLTCLRDKTMFIMRMAIICVVALCFSIMYSGIGNDASFIFDNQKYIVFSIFHAMFFGFNSQLSAFALELPMLKREHFNRWYTVGSYYLALSFVDLPALILNNIIYVSLTYICTGQPLEFFRFGIFILVSILVAYTSQGLGIFASSMAKTMQRSLILASCLIMMFCTFSGFFILMKDAAKFFHIFFKLSFLKHAIDACFIGIFGYGRGKMDCDAVYCHFRWPQKFLSTLGVSEETDIRISIGIIVLSLIFFRIAAFLAIKKRIEIS